MQGKDNRFFLEPPGALERVEADSRVVEVAEAVVGEHRDRQGELKVITEVFGRRRANRYTTPVDKGNIQGNVILMVDVEARQLLRNWKQRQGARNYSEAIKQAVSLAVAARAQMDEGEDERNQRRIRELNREEEIREIERIRMEELAESAAYWGGGAAWSVVEKLAALDLEKSSGEAGLSDGDRKLARMLEKEAMKHCSIDE